MSPLRRHSILEGIREAMAAPAIVLGASFLGFGALMRANDLPLLSAMLSTMATWALPGQVTMVELFLAGAPLFSIGLGVALANVRILPLVVSLVPLVNAPGTPRWRLYAVAHLIAVTLWTVGMRRCPELPPEERLPFLAAAGLTTWVTCAIATGAGFALAGALPPAISIGLVFMNPVYFALVLAGEVGKLNRAISLALGATLGPLAHLADPDWGMLAAGIFAGTAGFLVLKFDARRTAR